MCVGLLLAGIVFLNVTLLEVNSGIAGMAERSANLKRENAVLRERVGRLGSTERLRKTAEGRGFVVPEPGDIHYVKAKPESDPARAARALNGGSALAQAGPRATTQAADPG
jgi:hypothetical protein